MNPTENPLRLDADLCAIYATIADDQMKRMLRAQQGRDRLKAIKNQDAPASLVRAIVSMMAGGIDGAERELFQEVARAAGRAFDSQRIFLPWALLGQRDLTVASAGQGGYLVATSVGAARDILRGWSVTASAGITYIDGLVGNVTVPRVTTAPSVFAIPTEATPITEGQPVLGQIALVPKNLACFTEFSRLLLLQTNAEAFLKMVLLGALGQFLDRQILQGSGAAGELSGMFNTAGVQTQSGTTLAHAGTTAMKQKAAEAGARDEEIGFVSTPAVRQLLENRERATGNGGFVWQAGSVADLPAFASNDCPTASMIAGPWPRVVVAQWGAPGVQLEINPYDAGGFKAGIVQARMILSADMAVMNPTAFVKSATIT